jgi:hypothetical protein
LLYYANLERFVITEDSWEQAQFNTIADALQDLLQSENGAAAGAKAIDYAITI